MQLQVKRYMSLPWARESVRLGWGNWLLQGVTYKVHNSGKVLLGISRSHPTTPSGCDEHKIKSKEGAQIDTFMLSLLCSNGKLLQQCWTLELFSTVQLGPT